MRANSVIDCSALTIVAESDRLSDRAKDNEKDRQTDGIDRQRQKQTHTQKDRQTDRRKERQTDRQRQRQTETEKKRDRERQRQRRTKTETETESNKKKKKGQRRNKMRSLARVDRSFLREWTTIMIIILCALPLLLRPLVHHREFPREQITASSRENRDYRGGINFHYSYVIHVSCAFFRFHWHF